MVSFVCVCVCVVVQVAEGREILVRVERKMVKKPFLGGYRHRETGIEYHHAAVQTAPPQRPDNGVSPCNQVRQ